MKKETGMLFQTPMVRAIKNGTKTETRRNKLIKHLIIDENSGFVFLKKHKFDIHNWKEKIIDFCPYGKVGDLIYVRETYFLYDDEHYMYKADMDEEDISYLKGNWKPSLFMPKEAARLWLEITEVKVERLNEITDLGAINEGIEVIHIAAENVPVFQKYNLKEKLGTTNPVLSYQTLWESINGKNSWKENPYLWVIKFKKVDHA